MTALVNIKEFSNLHQLSKCLYIGWTQSSIIGSHYVTDIAYKWPLIGQFAGLSLADDRAIIWVKTRGITICSLSKHFFSHSLGSWDVNNHFLRSVSVTQHHRVTCDRRLTSQMWGLWLNWIKEYWWYDYTGHKCSDTHASSHVLHLFRGREGPIIDRNSPGGRSQQ